MLQTSRRRRHGWDVTVGSSVACAQETCVHQRCKSAAMVDSKRFMLAIAGRPKREKLTKKTRAFLQKHCAKPALFSFFETQSYDGALVIGRLTFNRVNDLADEHLDDLNVRCLRDGLLIIGDGLNGDPLVVDLQSDFLMGFLDHNELGGRTGKPPRDCLAQSGLDIGAFYLAAAVHSGTFPVDAPSAQSLDAKQWRKLTRISKVPEPQRVRIEPHESDEAELVPLLAVLNAAAAACQNPTKKNCDSALSLLIRAADKLVGHPQYFRLFFAMGEVLLLAGEHREAAEAFRALYLRWPECELASVARTHEQRCRARIKELGRPGKL